MEDIGNRERNYKKCSVEVCLQLVADYSKDTKLYAVNSFPLLVMVLVSSQQ